MSKETGKLMRWAKIFLAWSQVSKTDGFIGSTTLLKYEESLLVCLDLESAVSVLDTYWLHGLSCPYSLKPINPYEDRLELRQSSYSNIYSSFTVRSLSLSLDYAKIRLSLPSSVGMTPTSAMINWYVGLAPLIRSNSGTICELEPFQFVKSDIIFLTNHQKWV